MEQPCKAQPLIRYEFVSTGAGLQAFVTSSVELIIENAWLSGKEKTRDRPNPASPHAPADPLHASGLVTGRVVHFSLPGLRFDDQLRKFGRRDPTIGVPHPVVHVD
ncbi:MAG TPA: hypothetical protein VGG64_17900 [Pirellulales bacterium]|jgi:hypothetical protein